MKPRIATVSVDNASAASTQILTDVQRAVGMIPNLHSTLAHAPAALDAYVTMAGALANGVLDSKLRESVAIAVAAKNGCDYCASAHTLIGRGAGIDDAELERHLHGESSDPKTAAALSFVNALIDTRGNISDEQFSVLRDAGFSAAEIIELVTHVGMNSFTNMFNNFARTEVDFPLVELPA